MLFEAVINARNSNMLHSVLFTLRAAMMGDRCWYFTKSIPEPARNWGGLKLPFIIPEKKEQEKVGRDSTKQNLRLIYSKRIYIMARLPAQLTAGDSLVARSQNTFCALFMSELKDTNTERNRRNSEFFFTTIPLKIWEFYLLDGFLNSTALAMRTKVAGLEFRALRTRRSHTTSLHPSAHSFAGQFTLIKQHRIPKALMYRSKGLGWLEFPYSLQM